MAKVQHGLGKGLSALLGDDAADLREIRKPVGYINKEVVGTTEQEVTADVLRRKSRPTSSASRWT